MPRPARDSAGAPRRPDPEILESFLEEAPGLLERLAAGAEALAGGDAEGFADFARALHGLKGGLLTIGCDAEGRFLHAAEDALDPLLEVRLDSAPQSLAGLLTELELYSRHVVQALGSQLAPGQPPKGLLDELTSEVLQLTAAPLPAPTKSDVVAFPAASPRLGAAGQRSLDVIAAIAGDLLAARVRMGEQIERLDRLSRQLGQGHQRLGRTLMRAKLRAEPVAVGGGGSVELEHFDERTADLAHAVADHDRFGRGLQEFHGLMDGLNDGFTQTVRTLESLRREVEGARRVRMARLLHALEASARDVARREGKRITIELEGRAVEVDKDLAEELQAPLKHLVRNAVSHGIESEAERRKSGKPATGLIRVRVSVEGSKLLIEVADDGRGLDREALHAAGVARGAIGSEVTVDDPRVLGLVFERGLSTRESADEVSGRGIGCDEVRSSLASFGGSVRVTSESGEGSQFILEVPLERQLVRLLSFRAGGLTFAVPSAAVERVGSGATHELLHKGGRMIVREEHHYLSCVSLSEVLGLKPSAPERHFLVLSVGGQRLALSVEALDKEAEGLIKPLGDVLGGHSLFLGGAPRGLDRLALVFDVQGLARLLIDQFIPTRVEAAAAAAAASAPLPAESEKVLEPEAPVAVGRAVRVLYVDDSLSVRKAAVKYFRDGGIEIQTAVDGMDALQKLSEEPVDIVFTDLEMPRMNGYDLLKELRADARFVDLPVLVVTSRSSEKHRDEARRLGATDYVTKPFTPEDLIAKLVAHVSDFSPPEGGPKQAS